MLYTLMQPDRGEVRVDGMDAAKQAAAVRRALGVLPDARGVYKRLTARENIAYFGELHGMGRAQIDQRTRALSQALDMDDILDRQTEGFSQGQRTKTAIARALVHDPRNVILDEPTNGLDVMTTRAMRGFLRGLRELCDRHGALLILDEIQCGMGRTGHLFACHGYGVKPDAVTLAKALGSGFPIGAMLVASKAAQAMQFGAHGTTFGGNPLAAAVAGAALRELRSPQIAANVERQAQAIRDGLAALDAELGLFAEVRGRGLMIGAQLRPEYAGKAGEILDRCVEHGLLVLQAGPDVLRFVPALNIGDADIADGLSVSTDYWRIELEDEIDDVGANDVLLDEAYCLTGKTPTGETRLSPPSADRCKLQLSRVTRGADPDGAGPLLGPVTEIRTGPINRAARNVFVAERPLPDLVVLPVDEALNFFKGLELPGWRGEIAVKIVKEIVDRLRFLVDVGLDYLTLERKADSLSGGEAQRIRLASQIGAGLVGVMYVLDEPSIGLHQRDNERLLGTLTRLRDLGNTVIVVEHDEDAMRLADYIVDIGPGAGVHGGEIVAQGQFSDILKAPRSLTGQYLSGKRKIEIPKTRHK
ncbi:aminotransferase class III-fold pyridoxal phosphate-dependent enzyme, partial [Lysobacter sp. 2RAB21]